jgi:hypothetical protein
MTEKVLDAVPRESAGSAAERDEGDEGRREMHRDRCTVRALVDLEIGIVGEWSRTGRDHVNDAIALDRRKGDSAIAHRPPAGHTMVGSDGHVRRPE